LAATNAKELLGDPARGSQVSVATPATLPDSPTRPKPALYLLVSAFIAAFAAALVALLRERFDRRLHVDSGTTDLYGLPVIGKVPDKSVSVVRSVMRGDAPSELATRSVDEAFRLLFANLSFVTLGERPHSIAVVSPNEREGKTLCCLSLGRVASELGISVLLVDADLRRAALSGQFDARGVEGLSTLLVNTNRSIRKLAIKMPGHSMRLMPSGPIPPNPSALLNSLSEFDRRAREEFDLVIYDTPPLSVGADASLVAATGEGAVLIVNAKTTSSRSAVQATDQLQRTRAKVLGVVLNRLRDLSEAHYYYGAAPQQGELLEKLRVANEPDATTQQSPEQSSRQSTQQVTRTRQ
jgi:capsular exopolysaccharide synthesis family protein